MHPTRRKLAEDHAAQDKAADHRAGSRIDRAAVIGQEVRDSLEKVEADVKLHVHRKYAEEHRRNVADHAETARSYAALIGPENTGENWRIHLDEKAAREHAGAKRRSERAAGFRRVDHHVTSELEIRNALADELQYVGLERALFESQHESPARRALIYEGWAQDPGSAEAAHEAFGGDVEDFKEAAGYEALEPIEQETLRDREDYVMGVTGREEHIPFREEVMSNVADDRREERRNRAAIAKGGADMLIEDSTGGFPVPEMDPLHPGHQQIFEDPHIWRSQFGDIDPRAMGKQFSGGSGPVWRGGGPMPEGWTGLAPGEEKSYHHHVNRWGPPPRRRPDGTVREWGPDPEPGQGIVGPVDDQGDPWLKSPNSKYF